MSGLFCLFFGGFFKWLCVPARQAMPNSLPEDSNEEQKFPLDKSGDDSSVQSENRLCFRNPTYDHLQQEASQVRPSEASPSPVLDHTSSEEPDLVSVDDQSKPDRCNSATPSPISTGSGR